ncbi:lipoate--protein ligase family protein [Sulfodiicoccus acidiphilus]|uniref:lipoate--protein ligase family protein n=1 Tax=Sulfodiicoccus acidiphilus TaxID=1670455 RepID=UPI000F82EE35|nr:biotin/lipoate A/B protein ligase family protein [Sulfodiicoccus acidiphilus]
MRLKVAYTSIEDPYLNLALDEVAVRRFLEPFLRIWMNSEAVVMGVSSSLSAEVNLSEVRREGVPLARRFSGGGTVFHDSGNLNYSIVVPRSLVGDWGPELLYGRLLTAVLKALMNLGAEPEVRNQTDVVVKGRKVSGNAGYFTSTSNLLHGTVLLSSNLDKMRRLLRIPPLNAKSTADPVKYRVGNLIDLVGRRVKMEEVRVALVSSFSELLGLRTEECELDEEVAEAKKLVSKYRDPSFIFRK